MTWTDALDAMGLPLDPQERAELEDIVKFVAINAARAYSGRKRSFAMLAVMLGAELEAARAERDAVFEVAQSMAERTAES